LSSSPKRRALLWLSLFLLALTVRGALVVRKPPPIDGDQRIYLTLAESLAAENGYVFDDEPEVTVHPLLPALHATLSHVLPDIRIAGIVLAVSIGALVCLVAGLTVSMMVGFTPGYAAGLLLALQPHHALRSAYVEPDLLAALLCLWIASLVWRGDLGLAGVVTGLAYLNRPEMFLLLPVVLVIARLRGADWWKLARCAVLFLVVAGVFVAYVSAGTGRPTLTGKDRWQYVLGVHQYRTGDQPLTLPEARRLEAEIPSPWTHLRTSPREFVLGYLYRSGLLLGRLALQLGYVLIPFAIWGAIRVWRVSPGGLALLVLPVFLLPVMALGATFTRHAYVSGVGLVALAGIGVAALLGRFVDGTAR
jgi:hypothetical protein